MFLAMNLRDRVDMAKIRELAATSASGAKAQIIRKHSVNGETSEVITSGDGNVIIRRGRDGDTNVIRKGDDGVTTQVIDEPGRKIVIRRKESTGADGSKALEESKEVKISVIRSQDGRETASIAGLIFELSK